MALKFLGLLALVGFVGLFGYLGILWLYDNVQLKKRKK